MMLDLHVWDSAFGLPSIDPECLAIITYLHSALPASAWRLIPSNDPAISPSNLLPALRHDGLWTSGYGPIVSYLSSKSLGSDLDANLSTTQQADRVAYGAFLAAHAAPLLDLSLYASAANWAATTRPAYSQLLPFPLTWTVPPLLRAAALKRVEHLGLADLDADFDPSGAFHLSAGRDALPETFRRHIPLQTRRTVREEMTPEQAVAIRLFSLAEDCLSAVDSLMASGEGEKERQRLQFFDGTSVSSLDCLAFGYLALMRDAPVPRCFLKEWLLQKTPRLSSFVDSMKSACLDAPGDLPWATAEQTAGGIAARSLDTVLRSIPSIGEHYATELRTRAEEGTKGLDQRTLGLVLSFMMTGAAIGYGVYVHGTMQPFGLRHQVWSRQDTSKLGQFGEVGSLLNEVLGPMPGNLGGSTGNLSSESRFNETDTEVD